uniref:CBF1-interacting co-repressor CIR N-terminal domain-containing protein n=1 Tax=Davidia involucrata TaxID=16924 RepID=A0A5B7C237_DAVIN
MGGHGGLNILPQKRWNVYNYDNREKVRKDEEAAAKEEQLKREQSQKRDTEFRLEKLRQARGLASSSEAAEASAGSELELESKSKLNHINLFEGIKIFDPVTGVEAEEDDKRGGFKKMRMMKKEAEPKVVMPEDEKYRLGYGIAGKGVKLPWYLSKPSDDVNAESGGDNDDRSRVGKEDGKSSGKKTLEELREERLKREKREKEREKALILEKSRKDGAAMKDRKFSRRGLGWK